MMDEDRDELSAVRGILNGLLLSIPLWGIVTMIMLIMLR